MRVTPLVILIALTLSGCRHPIEIIGEGDVTSASGDRDCLLEEFQGGQPNCTENMVEDAYRETYYATPRPGYVFSAWGNYCSNPNGMEECGFNIPAEYVGMGLEEAPPLVAYFRQEVTESHNAVMMGHSFFWDFAGALPDNAAAAGFDDHSQVTFTAGGADGVPISLWNNTGSDNHKGIKNALDQGGVTLLGMATGPDELPDVLLGYRNWIEYALQNNDDIDVFLGMRWSRSPGTQTLKQYRESVRRIHDEELHGAIDDLRAEFPQLNIYCIPYGEAAFELRKLFEKGKLPEISELIGDSESAIFVDELGHPGSILIELGSLVWLGAIYGADLQEVDLPQVSNWGVDLGRLAEKILNKHDHKYDSR